MDPNPEADTDYVLSIRYISKIKENFNLFKSVILAASPLSLILSSIIEEQGIFVDGIFDKVAFSNIRYLLKNNGILYTSSQFEYKDNDEIKTNELLFIGKLFCLGFKFDSYVKFSIYGDNLYHKYIKLNIPTKEESFEYLINSRSILDKQFRVQFVYLKYFIFYIR